MVRVVLEKVGGRVRRHEMVGGVHKRVQIRVKGNRWFHRFDLLLECEQDNIYEGIRGN